MAQGRNCSGPGRSLSISCRFVAPSMSTAQKTNMGGRERIHNIFLIFRNVYSSLSKTYIVSFVRFFAISYYMRNSQQFDLPESSDLEGESIILRSVKVPSPRGVLAYWKPRKFVEHLLQAAKITAILILPIPLGTVHAQAQTQTSTRGSRTSIMEDASKRITVLPVGGKGRGPRYGEVIRVKDVRMEAGRVAYEKSPDYLLSYTDEQNSSSSSRGATLATGKGDAPDGARPRVVDIGTNVGTTPTGVNFYIDASHQGLFSYKVINQGMMVPSKVNCTHCTASLGSRVPLSQFDIVYEEQTSAPVQFAPSEIEMLQSYVRNGGSLYLKGNLRMPICQVFEAFGARLVGDVATFPYKTADWLCALGASAQIPIARKQTQVSLIPPPDAYVAVRGANGVPIAAWFRYGKGRVVCLADDNICWDLKAKNDAARKAICSTTEALIFSLVPPGRTVPSNGGQIVHIDEELEKELGPDLVIRYPRTLTSQALAFASTAREIYDFLNNKFGEFQAAPSPARRPFTIHIIAGNSGGFAGPRFVGLPAFGSMKDTVMIAGHEFTHTLVPEGLPGILNEGWACLMGERVANARGVYDYNCKSEVQLYNELFARIDPSGKEIDFTSDPNPGDNDFHAARIKLQWMILRLEQTFGSDFMIRFFKARAAMPPQKETRMSEMLSIFSRTAGKNLMPWYAHLGLSNDPAVAVSLETLSPLSPDEMTSLTLR